VAFLEHFPAHVRLADFIDIAVIAYLLYTCLSWLQQRTSGAFTLGFALVGSLYLLARFLGMYLTLHVFQAGISVILIALVVIFQQDLRRGFEILATWKPWTGWRKALSHTAPSVVDTVAETITILAESRVGALIVVKGREPLDRHLRGGISLRGRISTPILHSIFHPMSQGHDGAVLIENNRIEKFGVHLPLSINLSKLRNNRGTRHTAALGLAERSDALVVVVSEERGTISLAEGGELEEIATAALLTERLTAFWEKFFPRRKKNRWRAWLTHQFGVKLVSLGMACVLWFLLAYRVEVVERTYEDVPVEYRNLPEGWVRDETSSTKAKITLRGPERAFGTFDPKTLKLALDMSNPAEKEQEVGITNKLLGLPSDLEVVTADTSPIIVNVYRETSVELPIKVQLQGKVGNGFRLGNWRVNPERVVVQLPNKAAGDVRHISTYPIQLDHLEKDETIQAILELPYRARFPGGKQPPVLVTIPITKIDKEELARKTINAYTTVAAQGQPLNAVACCSYFLSVPQKLPPQ
jgi:diadenylate cyclase